MPHPGIDAILKLGFAAAVAANSLSLSLPQSVTPSSPAPSSHQDFSETVLARCLKRAHEESVEKCTAVPLWVPRKPPSKPRRSKGRSTAHRKVTLAEIVGSLDDETFLEAEPLSKVTSKHNAEESECFISEANAKRWPYKNSTKALDNGLCQYVNVLFAKREGIDRAKRATYGYNCFHSRLAKPRTQLPRVFRALKGWEKNTPGKSRSGVPWEATCGIAEDLFRRGLPRVALCLVLLHDTYARVDEMCRMRGKQVAKPHGLESVHYVFTFNPQELGQASKVGEFDDGVLIDDVSHEAAHLAAQVLKAHTPDETLCFPGVRTVEREVAASAVNIHAAHLNVAPHQFRHGGAAGDFLRKARLLDHIQLRCKWRGSGSVKRYTKVGALAKSWSLFSRDVQNHLVGAPNRLVKLLPTCL